MEIEVHGRNAKLFVNRSESPALIVNGLRGEDLQGGVALWGYPGEESCFSELRITPAKPVPIQDGGEAAGRWHVIFASDYGRYEGFMRLHRAGDAITGTWTGAFGSKLAVKGTWRDGYVELSFAGIWKDDPKAKPQPAAVIFDGWIDGSSAAGRMKVEGRADGTWTASRQKD